MGAKRSSWVAGVERWWGCGVEDGGAGEVVVGDEVGKGILDADVELAEVVEGEAVVFADGEDALDVSVADAGDAEEGLAGGGVDVDGEELGVGAGPGGLGIFGEGEVGVGRRW